MQKKSLSVSEDVQILAQKANSDSISVLLTHINVAYERVEYNHANISNNFLIANMYRIFQNSNNDKECIWLKKTNVSMCSMINWA